MQTAQFRIEIQRPKPPPRDGFVGCPSQFSDLVNKFATFMLIHSSPLQCQQKYVVLGHILNKVMHWTQKTTFLFFYFLCPYLFVGMTTRISVFPIIPPLWRRTIFHRRKPLSVRKYYHHNSIPPVVTPQSESELQPSFCSIVFFSFTIARKVSAGLVPNVREGGEGGGETQRLTCRATLFP